ncbi:MAG: thiamine diphosphokinase [Lachnospiraceae bacterium]|nr:thiamine diphosphokinase [Lachnospiraceae bacterium]
MKKCVIVGGADIRDYGRIRELLTEEMVFIFCDSGLRHMEALGRKPDLIVGDFDSHENPHMDVETIVLPHVKDDTDTVFAVKEALRRGFEEFLLIGVVGGRLDHTLGNVAILLMLDSAGKKAVIADDFSDMEIVSRERALIPDRYPYFSLLNITGTAKGVTIRNALYPLSDAEITCEYPIGVSNEVLPGKTAEVTVKEGRLLIIKVLKEG